MPLKIIGAGHGRTGTSSLRVALVNLLDGPCYHMDSITLEGKIDDGALWIQAAEAKARGDTTEVVSLLKKLLDDQVAAIDYPVNFFYKELMIAYPEAKVILTTRETEKWYESVFDTLWGVRCAQEGTWMMTTVPFVIKFVDFIDKVLWAGPHSFFKGDFTDKAKACRMYEEWHKEVKRTVPKQKLLVFSVTEGYAPLCKFLEVAEPEGPFPNVNEKKRFTDLIAEIKQADSVGKTLMYPFTLIGRGISAALEMSGARPAVAVA